MDLSKARDTFLQEARELLQDFEALLLQAESASLGEEELNALFRTAHTIKGSAGLFGFDAIVAFTHTVENVLDRLRNRAITLSPALSELLLQCRDRIAALVDGVEQSPDQPQSLSEQETALQASLQAYAEPHQVSATTATQTAAASVQKWHIQVQFGRNVMRDGVDPIACLRYLATLGQVSEMQTRFQALPDLQHLDPEECHTGFDFAFSSSAAREEIESTFDFAREGSSIRISPYSAPQPASATIHAAKRSEQESEGPAMPRAKEERRSTEGRFLKVEAAKLDQLINLVGELVIAGASANVLANKRSDPAMLEVVSVISALVEQIRDGALNMRMVPVGEIFQRFPRVVRDVSREIGKDIELHISGEETELDKSMVEKLTDPLMHILRNALDHGIESAENRLLAGKNPRGLIQLTASHESGSVVIEVRDDGGGIRRDKVLRKAIDRGLVEPGAILSDEEIYQLLFAPGFSTADQITNLSGRGVGMDVVKKNIEALRGEIEVESTEGVGTVMRLRLPLTLAIIDGFLVQVGGSHFVIPLDMVLECIELTGEDSRLQHYIELRGEVLPYLDVREQFGIEAPLPNWRYIVVVQYGNKRAGLVVDQLLGELQVVIKPLGKLFRQVRSIGGSAILGNGEVALILDVPQLIQHAVSREKVHTTNRHDYLRTVP